MVHKRHLNQTKSRHIDEEKNIPVDVEPMEVLFDTFEKLMWQKAHVTKRLSKRKRRDTERIAIEIDSVQSKSKKRGCFIP